MNDFTHESVTDSGGGLVRFRVVLSYDGTLFHGWARQPGLRSVQETLEDGLQRIIYGAHISTIVAGRTDAGVHATGQVVHFDLPEELLERALRPDGLEGLLRRLRGVLRRHSDIAIHDIDIAPVGFDARFSPLWRRYHYRIADGADRWHPLRRADTLWHKHPFESDRLNAASTPLLGLHDWMSYCRPRQGATTIRTLQAFDWSRDEHGILIARVQADAFCHSMVRSLVGAAIAVALHRLEPDDLVRIRDARVRTNQFAVAPAHGLTLTRVEYPGAAFLAERANQTRARRR